MLNIKVNNKSKRNISPVLMLENDFKNCVFQQYCNNIPQNNFYINCGINEPSVIHIWYDSECLKYRLSTDNKESLKQLLPHVSVMEIDAEIDLNIKF